MVAQRAVKAGATLWPATEATEPLVENGLVTGAIVHDKDAGTTRAVRARYVIVADGANSRFGRALGTARDRTYPARDGDSRLFHEPAPRRPLDREPPRHPRPRWEPFARIWVDISGW